MATIYGPRLARGEVRFDMRTIPAEMTYSFLLDADPTQEMMDELAGELHDWALAEAVPLISLSVFYVGVVVNDWTGPVGFQGTAGPDGPVPGAFDVVALPNNNTLAFQFNVGRRGRAFRGRNYIPGIPGNQVVGNQVVTGYIEAWIAAFEKLKPGGGYIPTFATWAIISTQVGGAERSTAVALPVANVLVTDATIDSQRGRLHA